MPDTPQPEVLQAIVSKVFRIEQVVTGDERQFLVLYRGNLYSEDSEAAYDRLAAELLPFEITPLFRLVKGRQEVILVKGVRRPTMGSLTVNIVMFILTVLSVLFAGAWYDYRGPVPDSDLELVMAILPHIWQGWPFAVSLLSILLAHEFGHYFAGRHHRTAVSLPYFIPFPVSTLGTMGAFINMKEVPRNKRVLFDIGIAGPLAGLVVAIPVLIIGLLNSPIGEVQDSVHQTADGVSYTLSYDDGLEGNSLLYLGLKYAIKQELLPAPDNYGDTPALYYWARFMLTGQPIPIGGRDVHLDSVAWAGWAGLLVTFLNLIPAGQLDGGHILYAVFDRRVRIVPTLIIIALIIMGFFWRGWFIWAALIFLLGRAHAEPLDQITRLDPRRKALAALTLFIFILVLTPIPFSVY